MQNNINLLLRQIPKVDELLSCEALLSLEPRTIVADCVRDIIAKLRADITCECIGTMPSINELVSDVQRQFKACTSPNLMRVVNGTGIILHTNLGRAPLADEALVAMHDAAWDYSNLEYCINTGKRSSRHAHVEALLTKLTGAEAAMVVNNNAAAVLLAMSVVAEGARNEVIVSRGELVEIGGSFRVPDVLLQSGCKMLEVGTTNKTHLTDYAKAICQSNTGALLKVHTSNFIITGFVAKPTRKELSELARMHAIPLVEDLGSGCVISLDEYGISQPIVSDSVSAGVDIITFSGDKLLGGPQAGIIVGRKSYISKMKAHPLARALRIDKLCLAALEATLRLYNDPKVAVKKIPTLQMLCMPHAMLHERAIQLKTMLQGINFPGEVSVITETGHAGGGAMPEEGLKTAAIAISSHKIMAHVIERHFRAGDVPIIGRVSQNRFILDMRTIKAEDFPLIASGLDMLRHSMSLT